jgi:hypothetical protein
VDSGKKNEKRDIEDDKILNGELHRQERTGAK